MSYIDEIYDIIAQSNARFLNIPVQDIEAIRRSEFGDKALYLYIYVKLCFSNSKVYYKTVNELIKKLRISKSTYLKLKKSHVFKALFEVEGRPNHWALLARKHGRQGRCITFALYDDHNVDHLNAMEDCKHNVIGIKLEDLCNNKKRNVISDAVKEGLAYNFISGIVRENNAPLWRTKKTKERDCEAFEEDRMMAMSTVGSRIGCGRKKSHEITDRVINRGYISKNKNHDHVVGDGKSLDGVTDRKFVREKVDLGVVIHTANISIHRMPLFWNAIPEHKSHKDKFYRYVSNDSDKRKDEEVKERQDILSSMTKAVKDDSLNTIIIDGEILECRRTEWKVVEKKKKGIVVSSRTIRRIDIRFVDENGEKSTKMLSEVNLYGGNIIEDTFGTELYKESEKNVFHTMVHGLKRKYAPRKSGGEVRPEIVPYGANFIHPAKVKRFVKGKRKPEEVYDYTGYTSDQIRNHKFSLLSEEEKNILLKKGDLDLANPSDERLFRKCFSMWKKGVFMENYEKNMLSCYAKRIRPLIEKGEAAIQKAEEDWNDFVSYCKAHKLAVSRVMNELKEVSMQIGSVAIKDEDCFFVDFMHHTDTYDYMIANDCYNMNDVYTSLALSEGRAGNSYLFKTINPELSNLLNMDLIRYSYYRKSKDKMEKMESLYNEAILEETNNNLIKDKTNSILDIEGYISY